MWLVANTCIDKPTDYAVHTHTAGEDFGGNTKTIYEYSKEDLKGIVVPYDVYTINNNNYDINTMLNNHHHKSEAMYV